MTSIDFYFNAADRLQVACRLAGKALAQKKRLLIFAPQPETAQRMDRLLWTWPQIGFVPHCMAHHALAPDTPVLIALEPQAPAGIDVLLNLSDECPPHFERFERLLEIVSRDDGERQAGRTRYGYYRERGYPISNHDLGKEGPRGD